MGSAVEIRIPHVTIRIEGLELAHLLEELGKIGTAEATTIADALRRPTYEPGREDVPTLARATDNLRSLGVLPMRSEVLRLRDAIIDSFGQHTYRLTPNTGEQAFETFSYGPEHSAGNRLVDLKTGREWRVLAVRDGTAPLEIDVEEWR